MTASDTVVCVHGIWGKGIEMTLMKRRLENDYGFRVLLFSYPSVRGTLDGNAAKLSRFIADQRLDSAHLIGHSLGGVIALRMLATSPDTVPGRVVCIGSPLTGSRPAAILARKNWAKPIIGRHDFGILELPRDALRQRGFVSTERRNRRSHRVETTR